MFEVGDSAQAWVHWVRFLYEEDKEKRPETISQEHEVIIESEKHSYCITEITNPQTIKIPWWWIILVGKEPIIGKIRRLAAFNWWERLTTIQGVINNWYIKWLQPNMLNAQQAIWDNLCYIKEENMLSLCYFRWS